MSSRSSHWAVLIGAAFLACVGAAPAGAGQIAPVSLVPALDLYVNSLIAGHAAALACAEPSSPARDEAGWSQAKAVLLATLWANGFPTDFVRSATTRLDAPAAADTPDCNSEATADSFATPRHEGWVKTIGHALSGMELTPIDQPVGAEAWGEIRAAVAKELPLQARMFDCVAVAIPDLMPVAVHDWDQMVVETGGKLVGAGLPHDEITTVLSAAEANSLWHRADASAVASLRQSCAGDKSWDDRLFNLEFLGLRDAVAKLLPAPAGGDQ